VFDAMAVIRCRIRCRRCVPARRHRPRDPPAQGRLATVAGAPRYAELRDRALVVELGGISVAIAGLDDLIAMKRASGRPADQRDIAVLLAARDASEP